MILSCIVGITHSRQSLFAIACYAEKSLHCYLRKSQFALWRALVWIYLQNNSFREHTRSKAETEMVVKEAAFHLPWIYVEAPSCWIFFALRWDQAGRELSGLGGISNAGTQTPLSTSTLTLQAPTNHPPLHLWWPQHVKPPIVPTSLEVPVIQHVRRWWEGMRGFDDFLKVICYCNIS